MIIRRADGRAEEVGQGVSGLPLGIMDDSTYEQIDVQLNPGDVVVIYSDGVTNARSPADELYDSQSNHRLIKRVAQASGGAAEVGRAILQDIREFSAATHRPTTSPWCASARCLVRAYSFPRVGLNSCDCSFPPMPIVGHLDVPPAHDDDDPEYFHSGRRSSAGKCLRAIRLREGVEL